METKPKFDLGRFDTTCDDVLRDIEHLDWSVYMDGKLVALFATESAAEAFLKVVS
jgi:hypothetical protein